MGWISRLFQGSEAERARDAAEESKERAEAAARDLERWLAAIPSQDDATKAAAGGHLRSAALAAERGDAAGWNEAREQFELARAACRRGRAALARAHPRVAATLLLADAAEGAAELRDGEERSARYAAIAELQAACGDLHGARRTLASVTEPVDRAAAERALVLARDASQPLDAAQVAEALAAGGADGWNDQEVVLALVQERCRRGDVAGARSLAEPIDDPELKARAWHALAQAEARAGRLAEARVLASGIDDPRWSSAAWGELALAAAHRGDAAAALETLERIQDEEVRANAMGALAGAMEETGNEPRAAELLARITDPDARDDALTWIAEARTKKGDLAGAAQALEDVRDRHVQARELVSLAESAHEAGEQEMAGAFLQRALDGFEALRARHRYPPAWLARFLADARARLGDFAGAEAAASVLGDERERADLLATLAVHLASEPGRLDAVEDLLDRHTGVLERLAIRESAAQGLLRAAEDAAGARARDPRRGRAH